MSEVVKIWMIFSRPLKKFSLQLLLHFLSPTGAAYQTLAFSPVHKLDLWRYLTYALLHAGSTHLLINLVLQLVIAFPLETDVGHIKVTLVYVGGILSGSLAASLCTDFSLLVGASSGIYSLLLSYVPHIFMVSFHLFPQTLPS